MNDYNDNPSGTGQPDPDENGGGQNPYRPNWQTPSAGQNESGRHAAGYYPSQGGWQQDDRQGGANPYQGAQPPREPETPYHYDFNDYASPDTDKKLPKKGKKGLAVFFSIIGVIVAVSLVSFAGYGIYVMMSGNNFIYQTPGSGNAPPPDDAGASLSPQLEIASSPQSGGATAVDDGLSNEAIAAKAAPSVVKIANFQANSPYGIVGEGSGIIMSKEGYIITNAHVIEGNTGLQVTLPDDESYNAVQVGIDPLTDLAVIKLQADPMPDLPVAEFGDSSKLVVGERVIAIGNAGGSEFAGSVTGGMISALSRSITTESGAQLKVLQTDAAINPGNSGGALINKYGQVIGINSAKFVKEGYEGLGFAIPINNAQPIVNDLIKNGRVTGRPRLGIKGMDMSSIVAQFRGLPANISGVLVAAVDSSCDISRQGVVVGDVLTTMNGEPIESMSSLQNSLIEMKPGDVVEFEVYRPSAQPGGKGRSFTARVTLDEDNGTTNFPETENQQQQQQQQPEDDYSGFPFFPFY